MAKRVIKWHSPNISSIWIVCRVYCIVYCERVTCDTKIPSIACRPVCIYIFNGQLNEFLIRFKVKMCLKDRDWSDWKSPGSSDESSGSQEGWRLGGMAKSGPRFVRSVLSRSVDPCSPTSCLHHKNLQILRQKVSDEDASKVAPGQGFSHFICNLHQSELLLRRSQMMRPWSRRPTVKSGRASTTAKSWTKATDSI